MRYTWIVRLSGAHPRLGFFNGFNMHDGSFSCRDMHIEYQSGTPGTQAYLRRRIKLEVSQRLPPMAWMSA